MARLRAAGLIAVLCVAVLAATPGGESRTPSFATVGEAFAAGLRAQKFVIVFFHTQGRLTDALHTILVGEVLHDPFVAGRCVYGDGNVEIERAAYELAKHVSVQRLPSVSIVFPDPSDPRELEHIEGFHDPADLRARIVQGVCAAYARHLLPKPMLDLELQSECGNSRPLGEISAVRVTPAFGAAAPAPMPTAPPPVVTRASSARKDTPVLKGIWEGTGSRTVCGTPGGTARIHLTLEDHGYRLGGGNEAMGEVSGTLTVDGETRGVIVCGYEGARLQTLPLAMLWTPIGPRDRSPYADFFVDLSAGADGKTLTGELYRRDPNCVERGARAEVLAATLIRR